MRRLLPIAILIACMASISHGAALSPVAEDADAKKATDAAAAIYAAQCSGCHGQHLEGGQFGPPLRGPGFAATWTARRDALLGYISKQMPPNAGGSLPDKDYTALTDHIYAVNAQAAADAADVPPPGPQPIDAGMFHDRLYDVEMARQQALLAGLTPVTDQMLHSPPDGDWLTWRRTQDASGYSPLRQIDRSNVSRLQLKWAWSARHGRNEVAPIVHDGVMFINSQYEVEALDAANGTLLWRYTRDIAPEHRGPLNMVQRSIAIYGRTLLVPTADRHLVALDLSSGKVVWDTQVIPDEMPRAVLSAGPTVAGGVIVQGTSISAMSPGGSFVVGIDAETGKILWRFDNVPGAGDPADRTWNGTPHNERTGAAVWVAPSYDPTLKTLYYGTGGTYDLSRLLRPGPSDQNSDALYTNSTIALDPATGKMRWYHQHIAREIWDLDEAFDRTLLTVPFEGRDRRLLVTVGKMGILDALDRESGRYAFSIDLGLNNIVTGIDPATGRRTVDPARVPTPNEPVEICPSVQGARNWMATAYNPETRTLYLPLENLCMDYVWSDPGGAFDSTVDNGWKLKAAPGSDGKPGRIQAIDMASRKTRWIETMRGVPSSSLLATAGGLLFTGSTNRTFSALNDSTGETLWQTRLAAAPNATPVTFSVDGKQYVAIASGGGGDQASQTEQVTPEVIPSAPATTIWVFGL